MTRYISTAAVLCSIVATYCAGPIAAQTYERVQPIELTSLPAISQSPATIVPQPLVQRAYADSYMSPSVSEVLPPVIDAAEMVPLPAGPTWRGRAVQPVAPVTAFSAAAPVATPTPRVEVLRPIPGPTVPQGYVLGRGLVGQPKLFKPGQPVLNLLRYLSL
jgi:hypothetical protein